jgi:hypothetical protein
MSERQKCMVILVSGRSFAVGRSDRPGDGEEGPSRGQEAGENRVDRGRRGAVRPGAGGYQEAEGLQAVTPARPETRRGKRHRSARARDRRELLRAQRLLERAGHRGRAVAGVDKADLG